MLYYCVCNDFVNKEYQHLPADIRYPSGTKERDRPTPSPESGHSAGCSWAPVRVQALREQERVLQEQVLRERVLRERVPGQGCSVQPQVQRARQCR